MRHKKTYHDMETSRADMTDFRRPAYSVRHPARYSDNEYSNTQNTSMAGKLMRVQAEQIREDPAECAERKYGIRGEADGQEHTE